MKLLYRTLVTFLIALGLGSATGTTEILEQLSTLKTPLHVTCGGVLDEEEVLAISYKPDTIISPNERCVWTISSPRTVNYQLDALSYGLQTQTNETGIIATCLENNTYVRPSIPITQAGRVSLNPRCPILIITFYSGEDVSNSRGFVLFYRATTGTSHGISAASKQFVINTAFEGAITYPLEVGTQYTNLEVSTFVFTPSDNIYIPNRYSTVAYSRSGLSFCSDHISVYRFSPSFGWRNNLSIPWDMICDYTPFAWWSTDELLMLIFRSDFQNVNYGFHLTYSNQSLYCK
ncbi:hypothetical protein Ocin01_13336 [Orchesella cincta]|uniref:CUB domain-containing protein n=1 Tax=Orchesella cincta TaxID=48709 RepID=A0A1D2MJU9_ORCCI|nr:hypothetical protein Ocin01_13336 [Orchesella cincta]